MFPERIKISAVTVKVVVWVLIKDWRLSGVSGLIKQTLRDNPMRIQGISDNCGKQLLPFGGRAQINRDGT